MIFYLLCFNVIQSECDNKVYGVELSDTQIKGLLDGNSTSYTSKGRKTIVRPEIVENPYNGKVYYQWKTERGK